jgi:cytochrome c oxidase subunit 2
VEKNVFSMTSRIFAILLWILAAVTIVLFTRPKWWLPPAISAHAGAIDRQFKLTMIIMAIGFVVVHALLGLALWRYRARGRESAYSVGNATFEIGITVVVAAVFLYLAITGQRVWADLRLGAAPAGAVEVEVTGQQFLWNFRYPGADGIFGRTDPRLYNDADNSIGARPGPLGIDSKDSAGKDDLVSSLLVLPVNRPISVTLRAKDVTHDFYVPALRLKQDAVPGMKIRMHFTATRPGRYEIACAELCGQLHHQMRAYLEIKSQEEYAAWLKERTPR